MNTKLPVARGRWHRRRAGDERGMALLAVVMVMMLLSVLMVGFVAAIVEDQNASGLNRDQTQAYAAAHAGLEKLTSDMTSLFRRDVSPSMAQVNALVVPAMVPVIPGFTFVAPGGGVGYTAAPALGVDGNGNPRPEDAVNGSEITHGPFQGLKGIITPYDMTVTARSRGLAEVRLRRTLQTVAIPVFQFGMFSETNLAFHAGGTFTFGGRVHTNGHLFLSAGTLLRLGDRTTAVGEVLRWNLPNGVPATGGYGGRVEVIRGTGLYRDLLRTEGSLRNDLGSPVNEPTWTNLSVGTYNQYIRNGRTGVRRLDLPIVADVDGDGQPDGAPIDLIRRPPQGNVDPPTVLQQRYYSTASVRILLSDTAADITNLPGIAGGAPVELSIGKAYANNPDPQRAPLATSNGPDAYPGGAAGLRAGVYRSDHDTPLIGGFIKIEMARQNGVWEDITNEILSFGIVGRNLADSNEPEATRWNNLPEGALDACAEPQPNAIVRLQRLRDIPADPAYRPCGTVGGNVPQDFHDYWPMALYDTREGQFRDGLADGQMRLGGLINYVELDVNNLRRWLIGPAAGLPGVGNNARNENGFIVYFSDRRNNRNNAGNETGEYGFEDVASPPDWNSVNAAVDPGEDVNGNGVMDNYGQLPRNQPNCSELGVPVLPSLAVCTPAPFDDNARPWTLIPHLGGAPAAQPGERALVARANRIVHFRRALKLTNGQLGNLPMPGLTVVSENPVYIQGNYNATAASVTDPGSAAAAVIADSITLLSSDWNDIKSFMSPTNPNGRVAVNTGYRAAFVSGKGIAFPRPAFAADSFGSDGGVHNFMRLLENWNGRTILYRGSLVSLFFNRQATGTFKCCDYDVYQPGTRNWTFDTNFLLPPGLPPGTPMFRDVNTLTFRQLLRPTQ